LITVEAVSSVPSIRQVLAQTIAAGSRSVTMKVVGTNFPNNVVILWNGTLAAGGACLDLATNYTGMA
jgi:hypothetical protein